MTETDSIAWYRLRARAAACTVALGLLLGAPAAEGQRGKRLQKALHELRAQGLELIYSARLVRPELRVAEAPTGSLAEQLEQLLTPHGLTALETEGGAFLVIANIDESVAAPLLLQGAVFSAHTGSPLNGVSVRIVDVQSIGADSPTVARGVEGGGNSSSAPSVIGTLATTGPVGAFRFAGLAPGLYQLEAGRDDHLVERASVVVQPLPSRSGRAVGVQPRVRIDLLPRAFLNDEIAVRASEVSLLTETGPSSLSLDRAQVASLPRLGNDVFRALSILPGVVSNDVSAQPQIRGGRRDELQVVLDGQELYGAYHLQDYDNGLSIVAADDLAQVDVIAGNFTAANGDRMGGVLDLRTGTPDGRGGRLSLSAVNIEASYRAKIARDRGSWQVTGRRGSLEYVSRLFGDENPGFWDVLGKAEFQLGDRQQLRINGLMAGDGIDFVEVVGSGAAREVDTLNTRYRNDQFWLTHQALVGERTLLLTSVSHGRLARDRAGSESAEEQTLGLLDRRELEVDEARQSWSMQLTPHRTLEFGGAWRSYESDFLYQSTFERELTAVGDEVALSTPPEDFQATFEGDHLGAYVSDRLRVGERLTVETGLRYDSYSRSLLPADASSNAWSPRLNLGYQVSERTILRAGWGLYHQSQRPYEIAVEDGQTGPARLERSNQAVLGLEHQFLNRKLKGLRIEAYRRRISDPRIRFNNAFEPFNVLQELEPDRVGIDPIRSRADGIEVVLRGTLGARTDWWFNYSFSRSEDLLGSSEGGLRFVERESDQPHALSLVTAVRLPRAWQLSLALRYHTGWPVTPSSLRLLTTEEEGGAGDDESDESDESEESDAGLLVLTGLNSERLDDYYRLDLRLSKTWDLSRGSLMFFLDIQNGLDRQNVSGLDHSLDDGVLTASPERWPGIFPSLGLRWTF